MYIVRCNIELNRKNLVLLILFKQLIIVKYVELIRKKITPGLEQGATDVIKNLYIGIK